MPTGTPPKPGRTAHPLTPALAMQLSDADLFGVISQSAADARKTVAKTRAAIEETKAMLDKPQPEPKRPSKLGAEKLTPEEQKRRFIEAAREAGASEDEADFDSAMKQILKPAKLDKNHD